jgi:probable rRNA maturation factor
MDASSIPTKGPPELIEIAVNNRQRAHRVDRRQLIEAARVVFRGEGVGRGEISLAVVDDAEMRSLNRRHLGHDYPTDVLSFLLDSSPGEIVGEIIVSADTAARTAGELGLTVAGELLLYVVHGALHLAGHDDHTDGDARKMRRLEARYLRAWEAAARALPKQRGQTRAAPALAHDGEVAP